ncbi:MAG: site-specific integrase [Faecalibacterium sp.]|nr:site-specific integrase [Ruminococcus sp.]MCM1392168.1 site-specific integrase [Ruminococcus sp.]MCM1486028.1 site-specific integrase [Faecalibacterium sp.]
MAKRKEKKVVIDGKRISIYYHNDKEFMEKYKKLIEKQEEYKKMSFKKLAELWQSEHEEQIQKYTQECYKAPLADVIAWFGNKSINDIRPMDIQSRINEMYKQGFARQTINLRKIVLNQIYNYAVLNNFVAANPIPSIKIPKNAPKQKRELPESDSLKKIIVNVNVPFGLYTLLIATTGCRRGEVCALTKNDFDFDKNTITINKVCILSDNTKPIIREGTKSKSGNRTVPILPAVKNILMESVKKCESDYLINYKGNALVKWQFDKMYKKYKDRTGINFTSHQLRHLYATLCYDAGLDIKDTQALLGHSKSSTTQDIYIHIRQQRKEESNRKLSEQIDKQLRQEMS